MTGPGDRLADDEVRFWMDAAASDVVKASTHAWSSIADVHLSAELVTDIGMLARIANERVPFLLARRLMWVTAFVGVNVGAAASSFVWWVML